MASEDPLNAAAICEREGFTMDFQLDVDKKDVEQAIEHMLRLNSLGQFADAQTVVEESLQEFDDLFPVAIEIMRLMYDQGDFSRLLDYADSLLDASSRDQDLWRTEWKLTIMLFRDVCARHLGNSNTTTLEPSTGYPDALGLERTTNCFTYPSEEQVTPPYPLNSMFKMELTVRSFYLLY
jgi:hypothetical protein